MKRRLKSRWVMAGLLAILGLLVITSGCTGTTITKTAAVTTPLPTADAKPQPPAASAGPVSGETPFKYGGLQIRIPADGKNPAVEDNGTLPLDYSCDGTSASPPLEWSGEPAGTTEFCLIMWHVPGPNSSKFYWIIYNIPKEVHSLPKNVGKAVGVLGLNEHNTREYEPPCSSGSGDKVYRLTLYALYDKPNMKETPDQVTRDVMLRSIKDVTLASATVNVHNERHSGEIVPPTPTAQAGTGKPPPPAPFSSGKMTATSSALKESDRMPDKYTRTGAKAGYTTVSPPLAWTGPPADTQSFAVIGSGIQTGGNEEIHWILYNIPGTAAGLPEDVDGIGTVGQPFITPSEGAAGTYKKTLTVYALSGPVTVAEPDKADAAKVRAAMEDKILDTATLDYEFTVA